MASVLHRSLVLRAIRNARIDIGGGQKCFSTSMPGTLLSSEVEYKLRGPVPIALASKKKRAAQYDDADDLFSFSSKEDDLFVTETLSGSQSTGSSSSGAGKSARKPFEEEFAEHHAFVTARLGPNPTAKHPMVRQSALRRLLHLSQGREDLLKVVDLLVTWRDSGKSVDKDTSLQIIGAPLALVAFLDQTLTYLQIAVWHGTHISSSKSLQTDQKTASPSQAFPKLVGFYIVWSCTAHAKPHNLPTQKSNAKAMRKR